MNESARQPGKQEPDLKMCRTGRVGATIPGTTQEMFYCRIYNDRCKYARSFGSVEFLCQHPSNYTFPPSEEEDPS